LSDPHQYKNIKIICLIVGEKNILTTKLILQV